MSFGRGSENRLGGPRPGDMWEADHGEASSSQHHTTS